MEAINAFMSLLVLIVFIAALVAVFWFFANFKLPTPKELAEKGARAWMDSVGNAIIGIFNPLGYSLIQRQQQQQSAAPGSSAANKAATQSTQSTQSTVESTIREYKRQFDALLAFGQSGSAEELKEKAYKYAKTNGSVYLFELLFGRPDSPQEVQ